MISTFILWFELMGVWCVGLKFESRVAKGKQRWRTKTGGAIRTNTSKWSIWRVGGIDNGGT